MKGCPLTCWWCHNPESRKGTIEHSIKHQRLDGVSFEKEEITGEWISPEALLDRLLSDSVFFDESAGGITFSGGEPLMQHAFLIESLTLLKSQNIHTIVDTTGYASKNILEGVSRVANLFLYDLKIMEDAKHQTYCGVSNSLILSNLTYLLKNHKEVIIRFPVIPEITDTSTNINQMIEFLSPYKEVLPRIDLLPYHSLANEKYLRFGVENKLPNQKDVTKESLQPIKSRFEEAGFRVRIGG